MNRDFELVPADVVTDEESMRLFRPLVPLFRLWRLLLLPFLLSIGLAAAAVVKVQPSYIVTASIELINPAQIPPPRVRTATRANRASTTRTRGPSTRTSE